MMYEDELNELEMFTEYSKYTKSIQKLEEF